MFWKKDPTKYDRNDHGQEQTKIITTTTTTRIAYTGLMSLVDNSYELE